MTTSHDPDLEALTTLSTHLSVALEAIEAHHLHLPTPCSDWDLAALVDHVTGGNWFTSHIFDGVSADVALTNTIERFAGGSATNEQAASSVTEQLAVFERPGALDQTWHHVTGDLTGRQILRIRLHDLIVHAWDVDQTISPPASVGEDLVGWGLAELSDQESLTAKLFGLKKTPEAETSENPTVRYLRTFGRTPHDE